MENFFIASTSIFLRMLCNKKDCARWLWYNSFQGLMSRLKNALGSLEFKIAHRSAPLWFLFHLGLRACLRGQLLRCHCELPDRYFVTAPLKVPFRYIWSLGNELRTVDFFSKGPNEKQFKKNFFLFPPV